MVSFRSRRRRPRYMAVNFLTMGPSLLLKYLLLKLSTPSKYIYSFFFFLKELFDELNIFFKCRSYVFPLFKMSYMWYTGFGGAVTILLALLISFFTGFTDLRTLNPMYVSPVIRKYLPKRNPDLKLEEQELMVDLLKTKEVNHSIHTKKSNRLHFFLIPTFLL